MRFLQLPQPSLGKVGQPVRRFVFQPAVPAGSRAQRTQR
jgi:hypothetical protein